jgi:hypothetical protein
MSLSDSYSGRELGLQPGGCRVQRAVGRGADGVDAMA